MIGVLGGWPQAQRCIVSGSGLVSIRGPPIGHFVPKGLTGYRVAYYDSDIRPSAVRLASALDSELAITSEADPGGSFFYTQ